MSILNEIIDQKRTRLTQAMEETPFKEIRKWAEAAAEPRDFKAAIKRNEGERLRLIAELKKASPSNGLIRAEFILEEIAEVYGEYADAMSVLTEEDYFQGSLDYISRAKAVSPTPALRKDFIFDEYQVYEARAAGADAILLIAMALDNSQAEGLMAIAHDLDMAVLFEVHEFEELDRALELESSIIGINNRDLRSMETDLNHTIEIMKEVPGNIIVVSESGISEHKDVLILEEAGVDAMLVGTAFMREDDIRAAIRHLRGT